jgi:hypothetical protein
MKEEIFKIDQTGIYVWYSLENNLIYLNHVRTEYIKNSLHAYVWMQLLTDAGRVAKRFIDKTN